MDLRKRVDLSFSPVGPCHACLTFVHSVHPVHNVLSFQSSCCGHVRVTFVGTRLHLKHCFYLKTMQSPIKKVRKMLNEKHQLTPLKNPHFATHRSNVPISQRTEAQATHHTPMNPAGNSGFLHEKADQIPQKISAF